MTCPTKLRVLEERSRKGKDIKNRVKEKARELVFASPDELLWPSSFLIKETPWIIKIDRFDDSIFATTDECLAALIIAKDVPVEGPATRATETVV